MGYLIKLLNLKIQVSEVYSNLFVLLMSLLIVKDFGEENVVGPNDNVVRMMTIHSSKGLEFPFVIYSGLSKIQQR